MGANDRIRKALDTAAAAANRTAVVRSIEDAATVRNQRRTAVGGESAATAASLVARVDRLGSRVMGDSWRWDESMRDEYPNVGKLVDALGVVDWVTPIHQLEGSAGVANGTIARPGDEKRYGIGFTIRAGQIAVRTNGWFVTTDEENN